MTDITITCPLGSECETIKANELHRCAWYTKVSGQQPDGTPVDEWKCAMSWMPIVTLETARTNRGQTAALESFRNEMVDGQKKFNELASASVKARLTGD